MASSVHEDLSINTLIGPGTTIKGNVETAGFVRVDGALRGDLIAKGRVVIGEKARMESDIFGTSVTVGGVVKGNIFASERVTVLATGLVLGDIITRRIQADEGTLIHGLVIACGDQGDWNKTIARYRDERGVRSAALRAASPRTSSSRPSNSRPVGGNG
ncbi:polymer-forming cytoskeletal protein [Treponema sp.]